MRTPASALTPDEIERLWQCYSRYASASREDFVESLLAASEIYTFIDPHTASLEGFSALRTLDVRCDGRTCAVLYASYADINPDSRGFNLLQRIVVAGTLRLKLRNPLRPVYFMFTASTYTSYLLLPRNVAEYWPHPHRPTPAGVRRLLDAAMQELEKDGWNPDTGVIYRRGAVRYRVGGVGGDPALLRVPEIRFYAQLNPGQPDGDTLACVCPLSLPNLGRTLLGMLKRRLRRSGCPLIRGGDVASR